MSFLDRVTDGVKRVLPSSKPPISSSMSGGIGGGGHAMVPFDDDMIVSKPAIIFFTSQIFFNFLAMACFASVASFQAHWKVGPSGLSGFTIFLTVASMLLSLFLLLVPVIYEKYEKLARLARALKEERVGFILAGIGLTASLLIAFITTISAWTQPGCKDPSKDPNASKGDNFKNGLPGWCNTKKAGAIFLWLAFAFWLATVVLLILDWRSGRANRPRDLPFAHPPSVNEHDELEEDVDVESASYHQLPAPRIDNSDAYNSPFSDSNRYSGATSTTFSSAPSGAGYAARPSMDAYGAFSDPAPSGFGGVSPAAGPTPAALPPPPPASTVSSAPPPSLGPSVASGTSSDARISRTMQYADPYAAVRASIASSVPPSYDSYQGYR